MLKNYFTTAYRNLKRNKIYALLNIAGLALGIGCAVVIYKVIDYEISFDRHHTDLESIYRVTRKELGKWSAAIPHPIGEALRNDFPNLEDVAMVHFDASLQLTVTTGSGDKKKFREDVNAVYADPELFNILNFQWLAGNPESIIRNPKEVALSAEWIKKAFGLEKSEADLAIGKVVNLGNKVDMKVVGVFDDFPETTDYPFKMVIYYDELKGLNPYYSENSWNYVSSATSCLVRLDNNITADYLNRQFPNFIDKYKGNPNSEDLPSQRESYLLEPLSEVHFNTELFNYPERTINKEILWALGIIGLVLVITACINFINLATAQAVKRSKEIGIRKVMGGYRTQLILQFLSETFIITFFALLVSLGVAEILLINLLEILTYRLHLDLFSELAFMGFLMILTAFVGFLSGLYPSFLLSRFSATDAIKNKFNLSAAGGFSLRRALVIFQFGISQLLIICTLIVNSQMNLFYSKELGFEKEGIILTYIPERDINSLNRLKTNLESHVEVEAVSFSLSAPTGENNFHGNFNYVPANLEEDPNGDFKLVDENYLDLYGLDLVAGRFITKRDTNAVVVNMQVVKMMGVESPEAALGEKLTGGMGIYRETEIVGVVSDFHTNSLHYGLQYVMMMYHTDFFYEAAIKFKNLDQSANKAKNIVEAEWSAVFPSYVFDYDYYDEQLDARYEDEQSMAKLLTIFSVIAIFIGCLGLYGLVTFMANQKTKEIGVRKVLGASLMDILKIFSRELMILLVIAFLVAAPISYFSMNNWLINFEYRIELGLGLFAIGAGVSLLIALATMGQKSFAAATANPAQSLKDE